MQAARSSLLQVSMVWWMWRVGMETAPEIEPWKALPPFKRDAYISTLQRSDPKKIARGIQLTATADLAIKTSQATPRLQLEMLVCELAS